ncbi:hypothetical protein F4604DRAFT_1883575 [Suillus subluteus]|nr:hypothetical protein F4604DRAFT_1883575 [Suillus subluteus]
MHPSDGRVFLAKFMSLASAILENDAMKFYPRQQWPANALQVKNATVSTLLDDILTSVALVNAGYVGHVPHTPSLVPYRRRYRTMLAGAFDVYLTMVHSIEQKVNVTLGRDTLNWRVLNACPPCAYALEDESPLTFNRMFVIDGGNSAKRMLQVGDRQCGDMREYADSDYMLPRPYINQFANEVRSQPTPADTSEPEDVVPAIGNDDDADTEDSSRQVMSSDCSKNWKAAASEEKKRMWSIFDETGLFVAACRHGLLLWVTDMVRSGELAKYPLAIISKILEVLGECNLGAYDIGCGFTSTISSSSLGEAFKKQGCHMCVDAFHGYAHNFACQTKNHPNGIQGAGLEDFGTIERFFSASNAIAPVICYASPYRRHVFLDLFFKQWDEDKYLNLATMIFNNYKQVLGILASESIALDEAKRSLSISDDDLESWRAEEVDYFANVGKQSTWDVHAMAYVELLQKLRDTERQAHDANSKFLSTTPSDYQFLPPSQSSYSADLSSTRRLETQHHYATEHLATLQHEVVSMEVTMGISHQWQPSTLEYQQTMEYMATYKYQCALDQLQWLVVQCLFELQKLNISQTAYKMRTHISKSLQTCCRAIQNAIKKYNEAALELNPPRTPLEWSRVSHYSFLEEFSLLQETRQDVREKPWAKPAVREVMHQWLRIKRAKEEIEHCNVEVRRLHTAIIDEHQHFNLILNSLADDSLLKVAVEEFCARRRLINFQLLARISQIYALSGFTGVASPGTRKGAVLSRMEQDSALPEAPEDDADDADDAADAPNEVDDLQQDIGTLVEYLSDLVLTR